ncbi:hypothetical protein GCM10027160_09310 [Streptomyces calidiresistens]|uniref:hypothetical protein n=1 Tax=Streptomyces calidiresistens TaxID=1485586 RepID=UPI001E3A32DB|nr:hypothetical protein [Streptomyces calidiresistens]
MRLAAVAAALPSRRVSNADILEMVREHSAAVIEGDLDEAVKKVRFWLAYCGSENRR